MNLDMIRIKQAELENEIKESESLGQSLMPSSRFSGAISDSNCPGFKLACVCAFLVVASLGILAGLVMMVSIKHSGGEEGEW